MLAERVIEWTEEWKQQGFVQSIRTSVLDALEARFGRVSLAIQAAVNRLQDPGILRALHKQAILANSLEEFESLLASYQVG